MCNCCQSSTLYWHKLWILPLCKVRTTWLYQAFWVVCWYSVFDIMYCGSCIFVFCPCYSCLHVARPLACFWLQFRFMIWICLPALLINLTKLRLHSYPNFLWQITLPSPWMQQCLGELDAKNMLTISSVFASHRSLTAHPISCLFPVPRSSLEKMRSAKASTYSAACITLAKIMIVIRSAKNCSDP